MPVQEIIYEPAIAGEARVSDTAKVQVRVTIGRNGQAAQSIVSVKGKAPINCADSFTQDMGTGLELESKQLHVTTVISDVSAAHNDVSFKIEVLADGQVVFYSERARTLAVHGGGMQVTSYINMLTL
ncbi:MAG TPA: hypothetical protein PK760_04405 [Flavobacteriales bacterium]|nr:hypothetical protein [Flavobacteriales bacterium]